jgi:hypothetical protein
MSDRAWRSDGRRLATVPVPIPGPENYSSMLAFPTPSQVGMEARSCTDGSGVTGLAKCGWLVEVHLMPEGESDPRFFAVGTDLAGDAEEAILRYPGIVREDKRTARRRLSDEEIAYLGLRGDGVRPYLLGHRYSV